MILVDFDKLLDGSGGVGCSSSTDYRISLEQVLHNSHVQASSNNGSYCIDITPERVLPLIYPVILRRVACYSGTSTSMMSCMFTNSGGKGWFEIWISHKKKSKRDLCAKSFGGIHAHPKKLDKLMQNNLEKVRF